MNARFNWRHVPAALGATAFGAVCARDQLALDPALVVVPGMLGLAVGVIGRALGSWVAALFFAIFGATLCWLNPAFLYDLPTVLIAQSGGMVLGWGLVSRRGERADEAPRYSAPTPMLTKTG